MKNSAKKGEWRNSINLKKASKAPMLTPKEIFRQKPEGVVLGSVIIKKANN